MDPIVARKTWRTVEPVHGAIYFAPEPAAAYAELGLANWEGYFASRAAPMGAVTAGVVQATFFNFAPRAVQTAIPGAWAKATPDAIRAARLSGAGALLRRVVDGSITDAEVETAAALARRAAEAACERPEGRPLFAAHAALEWPDEPLLVLWHAQTLLREFRGDGHIAALVVEGIDGCEALVLHQATGEVPFGLRETRQWTDDEWTAAVDRLAGRGLVDPTGAFTEAGRALRDRIETRTDELSLAAYTAIGEDGCDRLRALVRPLSKAIVTAGTFAAPPSSST